MESDVGGNTRGKSRPRIKYMNKIKDTTTVYYKFTTTVYYYCILPQSSLWKLMRMKMRKAEAN